MAATLKELQDKRATLAKEIKDHADKQETWNAEDRAKWELLNTTYDTFVKDELEPAVNEVKRVEAERKQIKDRLSAMDGYQNFNPSNNRPRIGRDGASLGDDPENAINPHAVQAIALQAWMNGGRFSDSTPDVTVDAAKQYIQNNCNPAGNEMNLRLGDTNHFRNAQAPFRIGSRSRGAGAASDVGRQISNDMLTGKLSTGGSLVGETLLNRLEVALLAYMGVLQFAEIMVTDNGETMRWPTMDDTMNVGTRVGEGQDATAGLTSTDPSTGRLSLQAFVFTSGGLNISRSFLTDNGVNFESLIGSMLGTRIGRKHNVDFTSGTAVGNGPIGVMTAATSGKTAASSSALAADEIIDLIHSVDPAYREDPESTVGFSFHDAILQVIRKLKDGVGRYLWSAGTDAMEPDRLHGYRYFINQAMDSTISSGKKTLLFGALSKYKVRIVNGLRIQRLIERRAEYDEDVFIGFIRADGGLLDAGTHPVKYLVH